MDNKENKVEEKNPIDCLFDEDDTSPISLYNAKGEKVDFEQIAIIPIKEQTYAILKPIDKIPDIGEDEALVFEIVQKEEEDETKEFLNLVSDIDIIDQVFEVYNQLMDEEEEKQKIDKNKGNK